MLQCRIKTQTPASFLTCGNLISEDGFVHARRTMNCFVLLLVQQGTLYLTQEEVPWEICPGEFFLLFPGKEHFGTRPSQGPLSYYWVHFALDQEDFQIFSAKEPLSLSAGEPDALLLPEKGRLSGQKRCSVLFVQLLDLARRHQYRQTLSCTYAMNLLLLQISEELLNARQEQEGPLPSPVLDAIQWIESHFDQPLSAQSLARQFHYHPAYLTTLFKKHMGISLLTYIRRTRIQAAKNLLMNKNLRVCQIAEMCGFPDEKQFMKLFKKQEGMTPTQYRSAFHQKKINTR